MHFSPVVVLNKKEKRGDGVLQEFCTKRYPAEAWRKGRTMVKSDLHSKSTR